MLCNQRNREEELHTVVDVAEQIFEHPISHTLQANEITLATDTQSKSDDVPQTGKWFRLRCTLYATRAHSGKDLNPVARHIVVSCLHFLDKCQTVVVIYMK